MYLVAIAWIYVVLMMALAEATSSQGSVLGAIITFVLYGILPLGIVLYIMGAPRRRQAVLAREKQEFEAGLATAADPPAPSADAPASMTAAPAVEAQPPAAGPGKST
jgi:hypothetical protein